MKPTAPGSVPAGIAFASASYLLWGFLPIYFIFIASVGPFEIVSWRIVLSVAFCAILITIVRGWRRFGALFTDRRAMAWLTFASIVVAVNWTVFVFATTTGHVVEGALGYFINPIFTVLLGVILLRERLRPMQWVAVGISAVAVLVLTFGYGSVPWIALTLALSFGLYGYAKNRVGPKVDAIGGLAAETALLAPIAMVVLVVINATTGLQMFDGDPLVTTLLLLAGVITATPLILFAAGARRIPLSVLGLLQYLGPMLQFITGVVFLGEPMPLERWIGFGIVWLSLIVLATDTVIHGTRHRRSRVPDPADAVGEVV